MQNKFYYQSFERKKLIRHISLTLGMFIFSLKNIERLWAYPSLLMSEEEIKLISDYLPEREKNEHGELYLTDNQRDVSGIIYVDDHHWSLWARGKLVRPDHASAFKDLSFKDLSLNQGIFQKGMFLKAPSGLPSTIKIIVHSSEEHTPNLHKSFEERAK